MSKKDGGPAFTIGKGNIQDSLRMSLRDYFAGQAITGLMMMQYSTTRRIDQEQIAGWSYQFADEMLKARDKSDEPI